MTTGCDNKSRRTLSYATKSVKPTEKCSRRDDAVTYSYEYRDAGLQVGYGEVDYVDAFRCNLESGHDHVGIAVQNTFNQSVPFARRLHTFSASASLASRFRYVNVSLTC